MGILFFVHWRAPSYCKTEDKRRISVSLCLSLCSSVTFCFSFCSLMCKLKTNKQTNTRQTHSGHVAPPSGALTVQAVCLRIVFPHWRGGGRPAVLRLGKLLNIGKTHVCFRAVSDMSVCWCAACTDTYPEVCPSCRCDRRMKPRPRSCLLSFLVAWIIQ